MSRHRTIVVLISILSIELALFLFLTLRPFWITPAGHTYTAFAQDNVAVNIIHQSKDGAWNMNNPTNTTSPKALGNFFYILTGKIALILSLDPILIYMMMRVTGGVALFGATYWLITLMLPETLHLIALILTLA